LTKKLMHFDEDNRSTPGYTPWLLNTPYSVKLLSSLLWTAFRNTRNCGKPWNNGKQHAFPRRSSGAQNSTHFLMKLNTQSHCDSSLCLKETSRLEHTF
jgi:hypothetical protein